MSKLIVKNLPNGITDDRLKSVFEQKGTVTDIQLKYTKNGVFRKFGFVGFHTDEEANAAKEYFDKTFIDTARIQVELCHALGDADKPRAWSQHTEESSRFKNKQQPHNTKSGKAPAEVPKNTKPPKEDDRISQLLRNPLLTDDEKSMLEKVRENPDFLEFLNVQRSKTAKNIWNNDDSRGKSKLEDSVGAAEVEDAGNGGKKDSFNKMKNAVKMKRVPKGATKAGIREFFQPLVPSRVHLPKKAKDIAFIQFSSAEDVVKAVKYDKKLLAGTAVHIVQCVDEEVTLPSEVDKKPSVVPGDGQPEDVSDHGRLFVRNLSFQCTGEDLEKLFGKYGPVTEVTLPTDYVTKRCKGYGIVSFMMPEDAVKALNEMDGKNFQGRTIHVLPAEAKPESDVQRKDDPKSSYKAGKEDKQKKELTSGHYWNTLFLGANAVVDAMAKRYNVSKSQVLDETSKQSAAVRVALGETQIVNETREFLLSNGVKLDAFSQVNSPRSRTVIVVKNLPAGTEASVIEKLFQEHGTVARSLLPPSGITALVEMVDPSEAKRAFRALAYSRFGTVPLYLEWAPLDVLDSSQTTVTPPTSSAEPSTDAVPLKSTKTTLVKSIPLSTGDEDDPGESVPGATLFVKNLNFNTSDDSLREVFSSIGPVRSAVVAKKKDPKVPGGMLSMGYGFVEFKSPAHAQEALKRLQHHMLDGHSMELKMSERTVKSASVAARKTPAGTQAPSAKILVRNIPFQASEKELREMFKVFGEIKSVRLPRKMGETGSHRGFCFVEYHTKSDAKRAFDALCHSTHLYGRRLVLEWAETDEQEVSALRTKVAEHFRDDEPSRKKLKKRNLYDELDGSNAKAADDDMGT